MVRTPRRTIGWSSDNSTRKCWDPRTNAHFKHSAQHCKSGKHPILATQPQSYRYLSSVYEYRLMAPRSYFSRRNAPIPQSSAGSTSA
jgi:hypothetical protein